ncbi:MAG: 50S ribosomal protein L6 [Candidatus Heimdallarchaeota archaeon]|nr:50S ribosomal protein L6 [Candidatus Heimdallarchaeota archaeon]MCK4769825.1 50S ribosomal protein L6 [Candidatus Heimdallarchaeota archaeon]
MQQLYLEKDIDLPENVTLTLKDKVVTVEGAKGTLTRDFSDFDVELKKTKTKINVKAYFINKKKKANALALVGYIQNMIKGVTEGYVYKSKIVYSHFPITVEPDNKKKTVAIKNLYGGRKQINVPIIGEETTVRVDKDDVIIEGIDKQDVGQTTANMQEACRLRGKRRKDPETFLDGVWRWDRN